MKICKVINKSSNFHLKKLLKHIMYSDYFCGYWTLNVKYKCHQYFGNNDPDKLIFNFISYNQVYFNVVLSGISRNVKQNLGLRIL